MNRIQAQKEARRAELAGRALQVILDPDGRIAHIILAEELAPRVAEMWDFRPGAANATPTADSGPALQTPCLGSHRSTAEFFKKYFSDSSHFLAPSPLAVQALQAFFSGADLAPIYERCVYDGVGDWQLRVMQGMASIERGKVLSYGELAARIGAPRASRAVGTACANNPLPLLYPCHRVVRSDGHIGNFMSRAGGELKRRLLEYEGVRFAAAGRVHAECFME